MHTKPFMPPKTTQTYAHSQLPCWFSRTLHTHNKNHLIISTSGTLGFQPLVDTFCSPAPISVEGGSFLCFLQLQAGPAEVGGKGRPLTKMLNCFQKAQWINVPEILQSQADGEQRRVRTWNSTIGLLQMGHPDRVGPWGESQLTSHFPTQEPKVDT